MCSDIDGTVERGGDEGMWTVGNPREENRGALTIETPLLKVPFEALRRTTKDRKYVVDEVHVVVGELQKHASTGLSREQQAATLESLVNRLQGLKRKLAELSTNEQADAQRCKARLEHLSEASAVGRQSPVEWSRHRLDRILVDHLLRSGQQDSALQLSEEAGLEELVDTHIFTGARSIVEALLQHDCRPALLWTAENKARLRKIKSKLEFKLHIQEFIELVRQERMSDAIRYAREHLAPWASSHLAELQRALAALAFKAHTSCEPYSQLFQHSQWEALADLFCKELFRLNCLTPESVLAVHLQAGLSALKMPQSYTDNSSKEDPLHLQAFRTLAEGLPFAKHVHSKLVCAITREVMDEHNPPMVMPNGMLYSEKAAKQICGCNGGQFVCPISGAVCNEKDLRRAYIS
ncbi:hypothetical protein WJX72_007757 [[Myrmecia] bisecta]|uniref:CTLH domain-containing protein n=1 Tax=[Myrmecia] bisecta TaxID=41462 RepID=A0AAW1PAL4_9CHLO